MVKVSKHPFSDYSIVGSGMNTRNGGYMPQGYARHDADGMAALPKDSPLMKAWEAHKLTPAFSNTFKWATHVGIDVIEGGTLRASVPHALGSLWACYQEGYHAGVATSPAGDGHVRRSLQALLAYVDTGCLGPTNLSRTHENDHEVRNEIERARAALEQ